MVESTLPRTGIDGAGNLLAAPTAGYLANPINGHELPNEALDDLQYACIFPLETPRDCSSPDFATRGCDCFDPARMYPVCQDPTDAYSSTQRFAKAFPGTRHLEVLKGLGEQAAVASVCSRNTTASGDADFGYRPALGALWERLSTVITP